MSRIVMGILLAACCMAVPRAARAQAADDSLGSSWSITSPHRSEPAPAGQEGRASLTSTGILMGLGLYGWSIPATTSRRDPQQALELYAAGAGVSALLPWVASTRWPVTRGVATMAANGATRGALHGALLFEAAGGDDPQFWFNTEPWSSNNFFNIADKDDRTRERRLLQYVVTTSLGEAALGYALARTFRVSDGDAEAIATFGDFGMIDGDAGAQWFRTPGRGEPGSFYFDENLGRLVIVPATTGAGTRRIAFATLAGGVAGEAAGALIASRRHYSAGGASLMRTTGLLGVFAGYRGASVPRNSPAARRRRVVGVLAGGSVGLALGDRLVAGRDVPGAAASKVEGATLIGGLAGLGLAFMSGPDPTVGAMRSAALLGGLTGFALAYHTQMRTAHAAEVHDSSWHLQLEPQGLLAASGLSPAPARGMAAPLVTLSCRLP